ncbi:MAG: AAA family ATPase [archaeon]|nr:AAA family ATPase [archaeon]
MKIVITGCPGTGKTAVAKLLAKSLKAEYLNEKEFALKQGIAELEEDEIVIDAKKLETKINLYIKNLKSVVLEGHILCEIKLKVDKVFVLETEPERIELRLGLRKSYSDEKIQDNVFCQGIDYCKKKALKAFGKKKVVLVNSSGNVEQTAKTILNQLRLI